MYFRITLILILFFHLNNLSAQNLRKASLLKKDDASVSINNSFPYTFQTWDARNGLMSNFCNKVVADKNGYIYVATNTGLFSFNGNYFSPVPFATANNNANTSNIEDLIIDSSRHLWFASSDFGLGLLDLSNPVKGVQYFNPPKNILITTDTKLQASKLCFDKRGNLWVGTKGNGLYRFDTAERKFYHVAIDNPFSPYNIYIRHLSLYDNDTLFVGLINGLSLIDLKNDKITHIQFKKSDTSRVFKPTVRKIIHWNKDTFAIATDRGTYWLNIYTGRTHDILAADGTNFSDIDGNDVFKASNNELWFATENDGIAFYRPASGEVGYSYNLSIYNKGIAKGFVSSFFEDKKNNLWIAHYGGLSIFRMDGTMFSTYSGKEINNPYAGVLIYNGKEAICFKSDAITTINASYNTTASHKISTLKAGSRIPSCVMQKQQNEYILFLNDSFFSVNTATYKTKLLLLDKSAVNKNLFIHFRVLQCFKDTIENKETWVLRVGVNKGTLLLCYYPENGRLQYLSDGKLTDTEYIFHFTKLIKQTSGKYWASTSNSGLFYIDINKPEENRLYTSDNEKHPLVSGSNIRDMVQADDESLWLLVYNKGLCRFNYKNKNNPSCILYGSVNGLSDLHLYNLVKDNYNNVWIISNNGLYCFETAGKLFYNFSAYNGFTILSSHMPDVDDMVCTDDNHVFISDRYNDFVWFKSRQDYSGMSSVSLVVKSLSVNDSLINATNIRRKLKFSPRQNDIAFQYDVLDYSRIAHYIILYRLDGFDKEWQTSANTGSEYYRHLPGNNYTFRIKLQYANGTTSPEIAIPFTISTVWYRTWWFMLVCLLAATAITYFINRLYVNQKLAKQKAAFEKKYAVEQERARISTELHDDLGGNLSTIHLLSEIVKEKLYDNANSSPISKISESSKELLSKLNEIVWSLNVNNDTLDNLASYLREQSAKMLSEANLQYAFNITEQIPALKINGISRRHILLLVKEALHNIIKHSTASYIQLSIIITEHKLHITIHDDGKGIPYEYLHTSNGNGIKNMHTHAGATGGSLFIENNSGTSIKFVVPLKILSHESVI